MTTLALPKRVQPGDGVALVSPSWFGAGAFPHRVERGRGYIESLGLHFEVMPNALAKGQWTAGSPEERVEDVHAAFADPDIAVVLCAIGGNHSNELVDLLDYDLIRANPKVFQGLSDITVLHSAIHRYVGLATFYGPALVTSLAEYPSVLKLTDRSLRAAWFGEGPIDYEAATEWTDEFLDFGTKEDLTRTRRMQAGQGWNWLHRGTARGPIFGGCLESLCWHVKGSPEWPDLRDCVLLLELSEEAPSPASVASYLTDLRRLGVMEQICGLVFSRPMNYEPDDVAVLWNVVRDATQGVGIPVLANIDCGHTDPMLTVPLGVEVHLDSETNSFGTVAAVTTDVQS
ncbi:MAG TPA: S66 peptidase family protein [Ilumatobacteraceae bacterium]|nr:S66 peptidase family protein [Ilumatobacteraceae bacterium]